ncbi:unnamed protein product [Hydatigera taeniaeformis]|uniref:Uncharacterized protein n=1 Tax=Hydatigena taeniaeformis TaxID=6205 RepID=A0A0R3XCU1_HYDTA|nr:unnamed protein product [Hydatigera taeniaeformis]
MSERENDNCPSTTSGHLANTNFPTPKHTQRQGAKKLKLLLRLLQPKRLVPSKSPPPEWHRTRNSHPSRRHQSVAQRPPTSGRLEILTLEAAFKKGFMLHHIACHVERQSVPWESITTTDHSGGSC